MIPSQTAPPAGGASPSPTGPDTAAPANALPTGRMEGRRLFADIVRQALAAAAAEQWNQLWLCDADFADWPLGERAVIDSLNAWAGRGRRVRFLACSYEPLRMLHPRLVEWRITWSHLVEARACARIARDDLPSVLWSPRWTLQRMDLVRCASVASADARRRTELRERLEQVWSQGVPAFPSTVLGL